MTLLINQDGDTGNMKDAKYSSHKDTDVKERNPVLRCMRNYIQVMPELEEKSAVIELSDPSRRHLMRIMEVIECGKGVRTDEGKYLDIPEFKKGDRILIMELGKVEFDVDGKFVYFVEASNVVAVLNNKYGEK